MEEHASESLSSKPSLWSSSCDSTLTLTSVPDDVWKDIFSYVAYSDMTLCRMMQVCQYFYTIIMNDNHLWFECFKRRYPYLHRKLSYFPAHSNLYKSPLLRPLHDMGNPSGEVANPRVDWYQKVRQTRILDSAWYSMQSDGDYLLGKKAIDTIYTSPVPESLPHDRSTPTSFAETFSAITSIPFTSLTAGASLSNSTRASANNRAGVVTHVPIAPPIPTRARGTLLQHHPIVFPPSSHSIEVPLFDNSYERKIQKSFPYTTLVDGFFLTRLLKQISRYPLTLHPQILIQSISRDYHLELSNTPSRHVAVMVDFFVEIPADQAQLSSSNSSGASGILDPSRTIRTGQSAIFVLELTPRPFLVAGHHFEHPVVRRDRETIVSYLNIREKEICLSTLFTKGHVSLDWYSLPDWRKVGSFQYPNGFEEKRLLLALDLVNLSEEQKKGRLFAALGVLRQQGQLILFDPSKEMLLETRVIGTDVTCISEATPYVPGAVLTGHLDQKIRMWNANTGEQLVSIDNLPENLELYGFAFLDDADDRNHLTGTWNPPCTLTLITLCDRDGANPDSNINTNLSAWHIPESSVCRGSSSIPNKHPVSATILQSHTFDLPGDLLQRTPNVSSRITSFYVLHPYLFLQTLCNHIIIMELETGKVLEPVYLQDKDPFLWNAPMDETDVPFPMGLHRLYSGEMIALSSAGIFILNPPYA